MGIENEELQPGEEETIEDSAAEDLEDEETEDLEDDDDGETVPMKVVKALRAENKTLKSQLADNRDMLELYKANPYAGTASQRSATSTGEEKSDAYSGLFEGQEDDDVLSVGQAKKILAKQVDQTKEQNRFTRFAQKHPDYQEVIRTHIPNILETDPRALDEIREIPDQFSQVIALFNLARTDPGYQAESPAAKKTKRDTDQKIANAKKVRPAAAAKSGAKSQLKGAAFYDNLTPEQLEERIEKAKHNPRV
jgi:hypothetical protein